MSHLRLLRKLGGGAFGSVYLAHDKKSDRMSVVKLFHKKMSLQHINEEITLTFKLDHPNLVRGISHCDGQKYKWRLPDEEQIDESYWMELEYYEGLSVFDLIVSSRGVTVDEALHLFKQMVGGLSYCHNRKIVHGDLKGENMMLTGDCQLKIVDFGPSGGTAIYNAPERGQPSADPFKLDIYALGILLFEALTDKHPFILSTDDIQNRMVFEYFHQHNDAYWHMWNVNLNNEVFTPAICCLLNKMIVEDPAARWTL